MRFYAAAPLITHDGYRLGTMNIIDFVPREFDAEGRATLAEFAGLVMDQMEVRLSARTAVASLTHIFQETERPRDLEKLITVSAWSRKIQVGGEWVSFEEFLTERLGVSITHGIDPVTANEIYGRGSRQNHTDRK